MRYFIKPKTRKDVKGQEFFVICQKFIKKIWQKIIEQWSTCIKSCFQKVIHKAGEFIGNKIGDKILKPVEEIIIQPEKREETLNELKQVLQK